MQDVNRRSEPHITVGLFAAAILIAVGANALAQTSGAQISDAQIAGLVLTTNEGEIKDAKLAQKKGVDKEVKDFAAQMVSEHIKNTEDQKVLAKKLNLKPDTTSEEAKKLKSTAAEMNALLMKQSGPSFDKTYIDQQVAMHQTVSADLDQKFIPAAKDHSFKNYLQNTKAHVDSHLKQAVNIQTRLTR